MSKIYLINTKNVTVSAKEKAVGIKLSVVYISPTKNLS